MPFFSKVILAASAVTNFAIAKNDGLFHRELTAESEIQMLRPNLKKSTNSLDRKAFAQIFMGIADGFGLNLVETCVEDSLDFEQQVKAAIKKFMTKNPTEVEGALRILGVAIAHTLPKAVRECGGSYKEVAHLIKSLAAFASPTTFAYHVGHDLLVNGIDIFKNVNGAIGAWENDKYHDFGYDIGKSLKDVILGKPKPITHHPVSLDIGYDGTTKFDINLDNHSSSTDINSNTAAITPVQFEPSDALVFTESLFEGFGVTIPQSCLSEDSDLGKLLDGAVKAAMEGTPAGITIALELLVKAYEVELPKVEVSCGPVVSDAVLEVAKAFQNIKSPKEILIKIGHNVEINMVSIKSELNGFISDMNSGDYNGAGKNIGQALKQILIGTEEYNRKKNLGNLNLGAKAQKVSKSFFDMAKSVFV